MKRKKPQDQKILQRREYKFDRAMQEAAQKARSFHPKPISMTSNINEFVRLAK